MSKIENRKEMAKIVRSIAIEDTNSTRELGTKFFFHWALLSGATLTLLIPFLLGKEVSEKIAASTCLAPYIHIAIIGLIIALISSSIRNFILHKDVLKHSQRHHEIANVLQQGKLPKEENEKTGYPRILKTAEFLAIFSYIFALAVSYYFISKLIF